MLLNKLQFYIIKHLLLSTGLIILIVLFLSIIINLLGELQSIGKVGEHYGFLQAFVYVILLVPHTVYQLFPILILVGGVVGLGLLNTHQELIIMRCNGLSWLSLGKAILAVALILILILLILGELIVPPLAHKATILKQNSRNQGHILMTKSGLWLREQNDFLHISNVINKNHLARVIRYHFNDQHQLLAVYYAQSINLIGKEWVVNGLYKTSFLPNGETVSSQVAQDHWQFTLHPGLLSVATVLPEELSFYQILQIVRNLPSDSNSAAQFRFSLWQRIFQPLVVLSMIFLAVPIVFLSPRANNLGMRVFLGIIVGFVFYFFNTCIGQLSILYKFSQILAASMPSLMVLGVLTLLATQYRKY